MTIKTSLITAAACGTLAISASQALAAPSFVEGDLLLGFYQLTSNGQGVQANTYVFDLGTAAFYRENTTSLLSIGNIGTDLVAAFGADWFESDRVQWGIIGGVNQGGVLNGDPNFTNYLSRERTNFSTTPAAFTSLGSSSRVGAANAITDVLNANNGQPSNTGGNINGAIVGTGVTNDFSERVPPTVTSYFSQVNDVIGSFGAGNIGIGTGGYQVQAALDLRRILDTTTGADLTSGFGTGNAVASGPGQFIGTFTIDSAGQVRFDTVPEPSTIGLLAVSGLVIAARRRRQNKA